MTSRLRTVGIIACATTMAGCATQGSNGWEPTRIAPEPQIYAGGVLGKVSYSQDQQSLDALIQGTFAGFGLPVVSGTSTQDDSATGYGAVLGYRIGPFFGAEIAYMDLGNLRYNANLTVDTGIGTAPAAASINNKVDGVALSALGFLPLTKAWEIYARAGFMLTNNEIESTLGVADQSVADSFSSNSTDTFAAIGASFRYKDQFTFRLEYQHFADVGNGDTIEADVDFATLQVMYAIF